MRKKPIIPASENKKELQKQLFKESLFNSFNNHLID
jgi:hypothetical protein